MICPWVVLHKERSLCSQWQPSELTGRRPPARFQQGGLREGPSAAAGRRNWRLP